MWRRVSTSLCRLLFEHPRASDALLFMTILSTDLSALRRRGYNGTLVCPLSNTRQTCLPIRTQSTASSNAKGHNGRQRKTPRASCGPNKSKTANSSPPPSSRHSPACLPRKRSSRTRRSLAAFQRPRRIRWSTLTAPARMVRPRLQQAAEGSWTGGASD